MRKLKRIGLWLLAAVMMVPLFPSAEASNPASSDKNTVLAINGDQAAVVDENGVLWVWGSTTGDGTKEKREKPVKIATNVRSVSLAGDSSRTGALIKNDNTLWMWGDNSSGQFGNGKTSYEADTLSPIKVMDGVKAVSLGYKFTQIIKTDNTLWACGLNGYGQLGNGGKSNQVAQMSRFSYQDTPVKIMSDVRSVAAFEYVTIAVKTDGTAWVWGQTTSGELGNGKRDPDHYVATPQKVSSISNATSAAAAAGRCGVVKADGSYWGWGSNGAFSPLGNEQNEWQLTPIKLTDNVARLDMNGTIIKTDRSLWVWGCTKGDGTSTQIKTITKSMDSVIDAAAARACLFAKADGTVWIWGDKKLMGSGITDANTPVQLSGLRIAVPKVSVTLKLNGGTGATSVQCGEGALITPPNNPSRSGYYFAGWYKDSAYTRPWNFDADIVTGSSTLYAKWEVKTTATVIAEPSTQKTLINGKELTFHTYILRDAAGNAVNFIKLRDVAYVLDGTAAQFNVDWRSNAIRLDVKQPYSTKNGAEMTVPSVVSAPAKTSETPVLTDGVTAPLEAFLLTDKTGGGHNYFKLRDIGKVAGFQVAWDSTAQCIVITTAQSDTQ